MRMWRTTAFAMGVLILCPLTRGAIEVRVTSDERPAVLEASVPEGITALAISPDGSRMAYAIPSGTNDAEIVWLESPGQVPPGSVPPATRVSGTVRDLVFLTDNRTLLGLHHRPAKRNPGSVKKSWKVADRYYQAGAKIQLSVVLIWMLTELPQMSY